MIYSYRQYEVNLFSSCLVYLLEKGIARTELMNAENTAFVDVNKIKADDDKLKVKTDEK